MVYFVKKYKTKQKTINIKTKPKKKESNKIFKSKSNWCTVDRYGIASSKKSSWAEKKKTVKVLRWRIAIK